MEYRPECFADPRGHTEPPSYPGDMGPERYLSDGYRDHPMRDVTSIRLAVTARDLADTVPLLRAGGLAVPEVGGGGVSAQGGGADGACPHAGSKVSDDPSGQASRTLDSCGGSRDSRGTLRGT